MKLIGILGSTRIPVGYRLAFVTNFLRAPILRRMEKETGLIRPELTILICLNYRPGIHAKDICEITEQPSNTISRAVTSLTNRGLIEKSRDTVDTRRQILRITEPGQEMHDRIMARFAEAEAVMLKELTAEETATLTALLDKLARSADRWRP